MTWSLSKSRKKEHIIKTSFTKLTCGNHLRLCPMSFDTIGWKKFSEVTCNTTFWRISSSKQTWGDPSFCSRSLLHVELQAKLWIQVYTLTGTCNFQSTFIFFLQFHRHCPLRWKCASTSMPSWGSLVTVCSNKTSLDLQARRHKHHPGELYV